MAMIPNLAQQPEQQFQPSLNAEVQTDGSTVFKFQISPFEIRVMPVPAGLMEQVVTLWMKSCPNQAIPLVRNFRENQRQEMDVIRTVQSTKNRG